MKKYDMGGDLWFFHRSSHRIYNKELLWLVRANVVTYQGWNILYIG